MNPALDESEKRLQECVILLYKYDPLSLGSAAFSAVHRIMASVPSNDSQLKML